ncbi:MAG: ABC transporter ATP-binding protein [bacterium]
MSEPLLRAAGLTKRFGALTALETVDLDVRPGEVHAILGENGAGKTTLVNLLFGMLRADAGRILWRGEETALRSPHDALARGIGMVHQHFMLVGALPVWENVALSDPKRPAFRLDAARGRRRVQELAERYSLALDPDARVDDLPVGARQRVEIAKALEGSAALLILDEPTAVLAPSEVDDLFAAIREMKRAGTAIVFISHKLDEVLAISDRVTVLRRGRVVARVRTEDADASSLARAIVGEEAAAWTRSGRRAAADGDVVLSVEGASAKAPGAPALREVSFALRAGEILGVAGVDGNGQQELVALLAGLLRPDAGRVRLAGADVTALDVEARWRRGLSVLPGDRAREGLVPDAPLWENLALREFGAPWARGRLGVSPSAHVRRAGELLARFDVRAEGPRVPARSLSGGNQQKLLLARELAAEPKAIVLLNPTRGLDVGAASALLRTLIELRDAGRAILLVSTELDELLEVSDRVAVLFRGGLREATSRERAAIGALMLGREP